MPDKTKYTLKYVNSERCKVFNVYKKPDINIVFKIFRKFVYFIGLGVSNVFYDDWVHYLNQDVQFIVFDACRPYHRLKRRLKKAKLRPIIYYWNPVPDKNKIKELKADFSVFSYSSNDAKKYCINYNPTFFIDFPLDLTQTIIYDGIFIGKNKGRLPKLERVYKLLDKPFFYVIRDGSETSNVISLQSGVMDYGDYLKIFARSKVIIEILYADNADFTLRTMEALFYQKKLITNNKLIVNAPFYNKNNILVLKDDCSKEDINSFLALPFVPYSKEQVKYYSIDEWLKRFDSNR